MKKIFLFTVILALLVLNAKSQNPKIDLTSKNIIKYEAEKMMEQIVDASDPIKNKVIGERVLGISVEIYVDTVFKRYVIDFVDVNNDTTMMILDYLSDYLAGAKWYYMTFQEEKFILVDARRGPFKYIIIDWVKPLNNGRTLRYRIDNTRKAKY